MNFGPAASASLGGFRVKKTFWFDLAGTFAGVVTMSNDLLLEGVNVKDKLDTISAPELLRVDAHQTPGGVENWNRMSDSLTVFIHDHTGTSRQRLPVNPVDGQIIDLFCAASSGTGSINLLDTTALSTVHLLVYRDRINATSIPSEPRFSGWCSLIARMSGC